jgi:exopolyphosphatase/guanosine-5'-triphosphate,3'-diphosphate pyrophosphatase
MSKSAAAQSPALADAAAASARLLSARRRTLLAAIRRLEIAPSGPKGVKAIHEVRVATRRAAVAIDAFSSLLGEKHAKRAQSALKDLRRDCSDIRDADVLLAWVKLAEKAKAPSAAPGLAHLNAALRDRRRKARAALVKDLPRLSKRVAKRLSRCQDLLEADRPHMPIMADVARRALEQFADRVLQAAAADLQDIECLHQLRISCKHLRYGIELFQSVLGKRAAKRLLGPLEEFQEHVGTFTDASVRTAFVEAVIRDAARAPAKPQRRGKSSNLAPPPPLPPLPSLRALLRREAATLRKGQREAIKAWDTLARAGLIDDLRRTVLALGQHPVSSAPTPAIPPRPAASPAPHARPQPKASPNGHLLPGSRSAASHRARTRLAAIDVGTNSIRLIVAETSPDGSYRVLDDEKEITRLGYGLHKTGLLDPRTQEHSAVTIARMKSIAAGYGAQELRVVATSACREAQNTPEFVKLVKEQSGVEIEIIPPEQEALLAYRSAANAFQLSGIPAAVVDIGGGSLEIVLSAGSGRDDVRGAGLGGGVIERVHSLPLGAVRLTEQFGGAERAGGKRFGDLTKHIRAELRKAVGKPPLIPQILIGTGGTFATLAGVLASKELGPAAAGLFSGAVQGREVRRSDLRHLLDYLRELSVKDRAKVPGLPADRADIIVAGLAVIDELLGFLSVNSFFVHEGGIRDGLLLSMVRRGDADGGNRDVNPMRGVKRLAKACKFEAAHAGHVTRLALRIFDQLAAQSVRPRPDTDDPGFRFDARDRLLLEAASLLHDIGYLVNYASHHKHSYHLIVHAELPGLTTREVQIIANVARYHRAAEPKASHRNFSTLSEPDQRRVRALAAILRIADGLDRTHMQQVEDVVLTILGDAVRLDVLAAVEPGVDIWGSARKSRLFERVFGLKPHFEWRSAPEAHRGKSIPARPVAAP